MSGISGKNEQGSFMVAGALFMVVFLMVAGFGVDLANYMNRAGKLQQVADGAALAGGSAMSQYADQPDVNGAYNSVLTYIKNNQGDTHVDLYSPMDISSPDTRILAREANDQIVIRGPLSDSSSDTFYRLGVVVYDQFEPYFMPKKVFGERSRGIAAHAVARVTPDIRSQMNPGDTVIIDCGLIADGTINIHGNKFNTARPDSAAETGFCANADIDVSGSNNGKLGDVYTAGTFSPGGGSHGEVNQNEPPRPLPDFLYDDPAHPDYDVELNDVNFQSWPDQTASRPSDRSTPEYGWSRTPRQLAAWFGTGKESLVALFSPRPAQAGPPGGPPGAYPKTKEMLDKNGNPTGVNVTMTGPGQFEFAQGATIDLSGNPIGIHADGSVHFDGNNHTMSGGIYATGDITVEKNNNVFQGDKSKLGGMVMWSEGDITVPMNNLTLQGLVGAEGDFEFTSPPFGGGTDSGFEGMLITGGNFTSNDNSSNTEFILDKSKFDYAALDMSDWNTQKPPQEVILELPDFSVVNVKLEN